MKGFSVLLVVGKPCWPKIQLNNECLRIVFGPFALWLIGIDMDCWLVEMSKK